MHLDHLVPIVVAHLVEHVVAQDARRVDDGVQAFEFVQRLFDHARNAGPARHDSELETASPPALRICCGHLLGGPGLAFVAACHAAAQIVDHDLGAFLRRQQRAFLADAVRAARDQNDLAFQHAHGITSG